MVGRRLRTTFFSSGILFESCVATSCSTYFMGVVKVRHRHHGDVDANKTLLGVSCDLHGKSCHLDPIGICEVADQA